MWATDCYANGPQFEWFLCHREYAFPSILNEQSWNPTNARNMYKCPMLWVGCGAGYVESEHCSVCSFNVLRKAVGRHQHIGSRQTIPDIPRSSRLVDGYCSDDHEPPLVPLCHFLCRIGNHIRMISRDQGFPCIIDAFRGIVSILQLGNCHGMLRHFQMYVTGAECMSLFLLCATTRRQAGAYINQTFLFHLYSQRLSTSPQTLSDLLYRLRLRHGLL